MYAVPDVDEVVAVAKELGIHLGPEEVGLYRKYLLEQLRELDDLRASAAGGAPAADGLGRPDTRVPAEAGRRPAQRLDVEVPDRGGGRRRAGRQDRQLQGPHRGRRDAHELWLLRPRRLRPRLRRHRGHPRLAGGGHHHRQERHERPERRIRHRRRHRGLRPAPQPPPPRARDRGIVVGLRGGRGRGRGGHLLRRRPGRLHPHPGRVLWNCRPQAHLRARVALRDRVRLGPEHRLHGPHGPDRGGRGGGAPGHRGARPLRSPPDARCPHPHGRARPAGRRRGRAAHRRAPGGLRRGARATCATWCWPRSTSSPATGADVSKVSIPAHHAVRTAQAALIGRRRPGAVQNRLLRRLHPDLLPRRPSSRPSTSCGPPRPTCSPRAPSCRSSPPS